MKEKGIRLFIDFKIFFRTVLQQFSNGNNSLDKYIPYIEYFMCGPNVPPILEQFKVFTKTGTK